MRYVIGGLKWALYLGIAASLLVILGTILFATDDDVDQLCCGVEMLFLCVGAFGGIKWLQDKYLKSEEDKVTQAKTPDAESQQSSFPSTSEEKLALGGVSGAIVVWLLLLIFTFYIFYLDSTTEISGAEWGFFFVIIPGFCISPVVAVLPGALGGFLGALVATWVENRLQRTIDPRIGPIIGGALGILVPLLVIFLIDSLGYL